MAGKCKYCEKEIHWSKESGSWLPYEDEGRTIRHNCKKPVEIVKAGYLPPPPEGTKKPAQVEPFTPEETYRLRKFLDLLKPVS